MAERDLELLDDYLANRLDASERSAFEQKLNTDPALKSEYILQEQFVNGIKKARVAELKAMMNNVPVPSLQNNAGAMAGKVVLWTVLVGLVGSGLYLYFNRQDQPKSSESTPKNIIVEPEQKAEGDTEAVTEEQPQQHDDGAVVAEEPASSEQKPTQSPKPPKRSATEKQKVKEPAIDVFDPTKEAESESSSPRIDGPIGNVNPNPSIEVSVDSENKKYNFHYQFRDGKLLLYGPFEKGLYEIMEFFSEDKRTIFLFYKENFYLLKDDSNKLKNLNVIEDQVLVKKLKEYRN
jgi:hypothetical protein